MTRTFHCRYPTSSITLTWTHVSQIDSVVPRAGTLWLPVILVVFEEHSERAIVDEIGVSLAQSRVGLVARNIFSLQAVVRIEADVERVDIPVDASSACDGETLWLYEPGFVGLILPALCHIDVGMWAGGAEEGAFAFLGRRDSSYVMPFPRSLQHPTMAPLVDHAKQAGVTVLLGALDTG